MQNTTSNQFNLQSRGTSLTPTRLSYVVALRGVPSRQRHVPFTYIQIGCNNAEAFLCMAASNPEGRFFALVRSEAEIVAGQAAATSRNVGNVAFVTTTAVMPKMVEYIVCDEVEGGEPLLSTAELAALAAQMLRPNGLLAHRYAAYKNADETLRYIVNECSAELGAGQEIDFAEEVKALGTLYFTQHPLTAAALDKAIAQKNPQEFFETCRSGEQAKAGSFDKLVEMGPAGFCYVGDADIVNNYLEMTVPVPAQELLLMCKDKPFYEPLKDFAMQRLERCDIWCKAPVTLSNNVVELYGNFSFGIPLQASQVPQEIRAMGKVVNLRLPPYAELVDMMTMMPITIGDYLSHENAKGVSLSEAIGAIQTLVAIGLAVPMRSFYQGQETATVNYPKWATSFNAYLNDMQVNSQEVMLASPIIGGAVSVPARDALVVQALNRVGMENSVAALLPELRRIANDPMLAAKIMDTVEPTPESARNMIFEVVNRSLVQWYAFGLLAA